MFCLSLTADTVITGSRKVADCPPPTAQYRQSCFQSKPKHLPSSPGGAWWRGQGQGCNELWAALALLEVRMFCLRSAAEI